MRAPIGTISQNKQLALAPAATAHRGETGLATYRHHNSSLLAIRAYETRIVNLLDLSYLTTATLLLRNTLHSVAPQQLTEGISHAQCLVRPKSCLLGRTTDTNQLICDLLVRNAAPKSQRYHTGETLCEGVDVVTAAAHRK